MAARDISGGENFPGDPVVKTPHFHFRGPRVQSLFTEQDPTSHGVQPKKERKRERLLEISEGEIICELCLL